MFVFLGLRGVGRVFVSNGMEGMMRELGLERMGSSERRGF